MDIFVKYPSYILFMKKRKVLNLYPLN